MRECGAGLLRYAKSRAFPLFLIGHVTKDGSLAGPKSLEHLVDAVVSIEGERASARRMLRATKNRFGHRGELALYEMTAEGLSEISNPSAALLAERRAGVPGSAVTAAREGSRSLLVEIQALVGPPAAGSARRVAIGIDGGRLALLLAVLERAGLALGSREVFASCAGGLEVFEPACDLAIVAAIVSSARNVALPADAVASERSGFSEKFAPWRRPAHGSARPRRSVSARRSCRRAMRPMPRGFPQIAPGRSRAWPTSFVRSAAIEARSRADLNHERIKTRRSGSEKRLLPRGFRTSASRSGAGPIASAG